MRDHHAIALIAAMYQHAAERANTHLSPDHAIEWAADLLDEARRVSEARMAARWGQSEEDEDVG